MLTVNGTFRAVARFCSASVYIIVEGMHPHFSQPSDTGQTVITHHLTHTHCVLAVVGTGERAPLRLTKGL